MPSRYIPLILTALISICSFIYAQGQVTTSKENYSLHIIITDKDTSFNTGELKLKTSFTSLTLITDYISKVPALLAAKGYPVASIDSSNEEAQKFTLFLYLGAKYNLVNLSSDIEPKALEASGLSIKNLLNKPVNMLRLQEIQERLLDFYEKSGYPFASVYLDSVRILNDQMSAVLRSDRSVLYHVDSIRVFGKVNLKKFFLQRYLNLSNGGIYNRERLEQVDKKISQLPYLTQVQASDITMLGTGSVLNLYLQPRRSSQVNFLVGFLPAANKSGKLQLTGDVNLDLKNILGGGESILVRWQQLQQKSPRLNLGFNQPYILNSAFGLDFLFDLFKKDSSYLQINTLLGLQYTLSEHQSGKIFVQFQSTSLLSGGIDTNFIKSQKTLPLNIDVSSVNAGLQYEINSTNYLFNPRTGSYGNLTGSVGIKKVKQNNIITGIKDPAFNYVSLYDSIKSKGYQLRLKVAAAHYIPIGKYSTLKTALTGGLFISPEIFRNELFQIGGYSLLRGFDEESIYTNGFGVASAEYRVLVSRNSYFFLFTDGAVARAKYQSVNSTNNFISAGLGLLYETKAGLINISFALGKRNDVPFNLREAAKLHFGYINYF